MLQSKEIILFIFARDIIKAFIQSLSSKRLSVYKPPREFFEAYPQFIDHVWRGLVQMYGEVKADLYCYRTIVPWNIKNIADIQQSIFDSLLLFSPTKMMAILLCTDETLVAIPQSMLPVESAIEKRFKCRTRRLFLTDFKGVYVIQDGVDILLSQIAYMNTKRKAKELPNAQNSRIVIVS